MEQNVRKRELKLNLFSNSGEKEQKKKKLNMFCKCRTPGDIFLKKNIARIYSCCSLLMAGPKIMMMMCHLQCPHSSIKTFLRREFLMC
jgi:hypothetical protein